MKENIKNKNIELSEDKNIEFLEDKKMELSEENNNIFSEEKRQIQALLDKYLAGETSNEEEELLRNYFEEHGNDIPEEWKPFRAMFSFVGFEKLKFLAEEDSRDVSAEEDSRDVSAEEVSRDVSAEEAIIEEFRKESDNEDNNESDKKSDNNSNEGSDNNSNEGSDNDSNKGSDKPQKAKQRSLLRYISISAAAAIALILTITGIRSISNPSWGDTQPECYAVIDGKVYTNPEKVHDEALDALQGIGEEGQDDAFEALDMMQ